ncbi:aminofutalosine synthase MqnE [bacterium]|nr:MAG: aminofutalosine synthase MqnE [bacterium]
MSLKKIEKKVLSGKRLTPEDAIGLFHSDDIFSLGRLASHVSQRKNGNNVFFIQNHHINPSNICVNRCTFCAFSRSKGEKDAYALSIKEIIRKLRRQKVVGSRQKFSEIHIVGGLHPDRPFQFYLDLLKGIKQSLPSIHIKAFTAVEIDYFSRISGLSITETLRALKETGLDSIPGGGAEIFNGHIRNKLCPEKINGKRWLDIIKKAHKLDIRSNATMLYGHFETYKHRVEHMVKLRDLQDKTGGFQAFIPLSFHPLNTRINGVGYTSGIDDIKTIAISRLFLDNFPHIKAYWIMLGEKIAQLALFFGADDLDGTIIEERITHSAGALSGSSLTRSELITLIQAAGKNPVERDSFYRPITSHL